MEEINLLVASETRAEGELLRFWAECSMGSPGCASQPPKTLIIGVQRVSASHEVSVPGDQDSNPAGGWMG